MLLIVLFVSLVFCAEVKETLELNAHNFAVTWEKGACAEDKETGEGVCPTFKFEYVHSNGKKSGRSIVMSWFAVSELEDGGDVASVHIEGDYMTMHLVLGDYDKALTQLPDDFSASQEVVTGGVQVKMSGTLGFVQDELKLKCEDYKAITGSIEACMAIAEAWVTEALGTDTWKNTALQAEHWIAEEKMEVPCGSNKLVVDPGTFKTSFKVQSWPFNTTGENTLKIVFRFTAQGIGSNPTVSTEVKDGYTYVICNTDIGSFNMAFINKA
jgi:hypothetical protein